MKKLPIILASEMLMFLAGFFASRGGDYEMLWGLFVLASVGFIISGVIVLTDD